jgi:hypothetical protein
MSVSLYSAERSDLMSGLKIVNISKRHTDCTLHTIQDNPSANLPQLCIVVPITKSAPRLHLQKYNIHVLNKFQHQGVGILKLLHIYAMRFGTIARFFRCVTYSSQQKRSYRLSRAHRRMLKRAKREPRREPATPSSPRHHHRR